MTAPSMSLKIELWPIADVKPYPGNPRQNDEAVEAVAASLREFGFRQPIVVDTEGVIIAGHTRFKAAQKLGLDKVPVHVAKDLSPEQIRAYRIADNQTASLATWDYDLLPIELGALKEANYDLGLLGFAGTTHHQKLNVERHPEKAKPTTKKLRPKDRPLANDFVSDEAFDALLDAWFGNMAACCNRVGRRTSGVGMPTTRTILPSSRSTASTSRRGSSGTSSIPSSRGRIHRAAVRSGSGSSGSEEMWRKCLETSNICLQGKRSLPTSHASSSP